MNEITAKDILEFPKERIVNDYLELLKSYGILQSKNVMVDEDLFDATEKERLRLLGENLELKKKMGEFVIVKKLMDSAGIYGYTDFLQRECQEVSKDAPGGKNG